MINNNNIAKQMKIRIVVLLTVFAVLMTAVFSPYYINIDVTFVVESSNLLNNFFSPDAGRDESELIKLFIACLVLCLGLPFLSPIKATVATLVVSAYILIISLYSTNSESYLLLEFGLLFIVIIFSVHVLTAFFSEYRNKQQLSLIFSRYIPPELVKAYNLNPEFYNLEGSECELSILFCDIEDFTIVSKDLDPKQLTLLLNEFMTNVTEIILKHHGTIDKYIGDCVMAFWGAPLPNEQHADNALNAALEIQKSMGVLRKQFKEKNWPEINCGIGINTGLCNVGNMGSRFRLTYTAVGDAVNVASRIERMTRLYKVPIIAGESTVIKLPGIIWRELNLIQVKGCAQLIKIYEPIGLDKDLTDELLEQLSLYHKGLELYREQSWDKAENIFESLYAKNSHVYIYGLYLKSIKYHKRKPPDFGWQGMIVDPRLNNVELVARDYFVNPD